MKLIDLIEGDVVDLDQWKKKKSLTRRDQCSGNQCSARTLGIPIVPDMTSAKPRLQSIPKITPELINGAVEARRKNKIKQVFNFSSVPPQYKDDISFVRSLRDWVATITDNWDSEFHPPDKFGIMRAEEHIIAPMPDSTYAGTQGSGEFIGEFDIVQNRGWVLIPPTDSDGN